MNISMTNDAWICASLLMVVRCVIIFYECDSDGGCVVFGSRSDWSTTATSVVVIVNRTTHWITNFCILCISLSQISMSMKIKSDAVDECMTADGQHVVNLPQHKNWQCNTFLLSFGVRFQSIMLLFVLVVSS